MNVRTLLGESNGKALEEALEKLKIDILSLSEVKRGEKIFKFTITTPSFIQKTKGQRGRGLTKPKLKNYNTEANWI